VPQWERRGLLSALAVFLFSSALADTGTTNHLNYTQYVHHYHHRYAWPQHNHHDNQL
jgi:hypothetical protein